MAVKSLPTLMNCELNSFIFRRMCLFITKFVQRKGTRAQPHNLDRLFANRNPAAYRKQLLHVRPLQISSIYSQNTSRDDRNY